MLCENYDALSGDNARQILAKFNKLQLNRPKCKLVFNLRPTPSPYHLNRPHPHCLTPLLHYLTYYHLTRPQHHFSSVTPVASETPLEENINRLVIEGDTARTVHEAISVLRLVISPSLSSSSLSPSLLLSSSFSPSLLLSLSFSPTLRHCENCS